MKKFFVLAAIAATLVISISSCKKEETTTDLTTDLVGTYIGSVNLGGTATTNHSVTVTKLTATRIQITPSNTVASSTFYADLSTETGGIKLTVINQAAGGGTIRGNTSLIAGDASANGAYQTSDKSLSYSVIINAGGSDTPENYQGFKQ